MAVQNREQDSIPKDYGFMTAPYPVYKCLFDFLFHFLFGFFVGGGGRQLFPIPGFFFSPPILCFPVLSRFSTLSLCDVWN